MAALDFPTSPTLNQKYTANGKTWTWDGTAWLSTNQSTVTVGTTAQRPSSPSVGMVYYNTTLTRYEGWNGTAWVNMSPLTVDDLGAT